MKKWVCRDAYSLFHKLFPQAEPFPVADVIPLNFTHLYIGGKNYDSTVKRN